MPISLFIHQFGSLTYWGVPVCFPSRFWLISPFFPWLEICFWSCWMYVQLRSHFWGHWVYVQLGKTHFGIVEWIRSRDLPFGGLRGCFSLSSRSWELLRISLQNLCVFFITIQDGNSFFVNPSSSKYRFMFWVGMEVVFASVKPVNVSQIDLIIWVIFPHSPLSNLVPRTFLVHSRTCILLCSASLCWLGWVVSPSSLWKSCSCRGLQWCWEIDEHTGLWLGEML